MPYLTGQILRRIPRIPRRSVHQSGNQVLLPSFPSLKEQIYVYLFSFFFNFNWLATSPFNPPFKSHALYLPQSTMHSPTLPLSIFLSNLILPSFNPDPPTLKITIIQYPPSCQNRPLGFPTHMAREPSHPQEQQNPHHKVTSLELFQVDYSGDLLPVVAHRFVGKNSYLGITELVDDIFYVMENLTFSTFTPIQYA